MDENDFTMSDWDAAQEERGESALVFPLIEFPTLKNLSFKIALAESRMCDITHVRARSHMRGCFKKY